jgi:hypothetical protein
MYLQTDPTGIEFFTITEDSDHSYSAMGVPNFNLSDLIFASCDYDIGNLRDFKEQDLKEWEEFIFDVCDQLPILKDVIKNTIKKYEEENAD